MTALEIPSVEDKIIVNIEVLPEKFNEDVEDHDNQSDDSLNNSQIKSEHVTELISSEPQTEDKKEHTELDLKMKEEPKEVEAEAKGSPAGESEASLDRSDGPAVRTRKPGTVVDLLVSSYIKKRSTRCKVGTGQLESD